MAQRMPLEKIMLGMEEHILAYTNNGATQTKSI